MPRAHDRIDNIFASLNDKSCKALRDAIENSPFMPKIDRRRLYASYDDILMEPPTVAPDHPDPVSVQTLFRRLVHGG